MFSEFIPEIRVAQKALENLLGLRYANPIVIKELIPGLRGALDILDASTSALGKITLEPSKKVVEAHKVSYYLIDLLFDLITHLHYAVEPTQPDWLHYYLQKRLQDFCETGNIHLAFAPQNNRYDFYYTNVYYELKIQIFRLYQVLIQIKKEQPDSYDTATLVSIIEQILLHHLYPRSIFGELKKHLKGESKDLIKLPSDVLDKTRIMSLDPIESGRHTVFQVMPRSISEKPHLACISMHEFGHFIAWQTDDHNEDNIAISLYEKARSLVLGKISSREDFPGNLDDSCRLIFSRGKPIPPIDEEIGEQYKSDTRLKLSTKAMIDQLTIYMHEIFADLFALHRVGLLYYLTFRDICHLERASADELDIYSGQGTAHWQSTSNHPAEILRLWLQRQVIIAETDNAEDPSILCLGDFDRQLATLDSSTVRASLIAVENRTHASDLYKDELNKQERLERCFIVDLLMQLLGDLTQYVGDIVNDCCKPRRPFPIIDDESIASITTYINAYVPATNYVRTCRFQVTHLLCAAYVLDKSYASRLCLNEKREEYGKKLEVLLKTIEDQGMMELYEPMD